VKYQWEGKIKRRRENKGRVVCCIISANHFSEERRKKKEREVPLDAILRSSRVVYCQSATQNYLRFSQKKREKPEEGKKRKKGED